MDGEGVRSFVPDGTRTPTCWTSKTMEGDDEAVAKKVFDPGFTTKSKVGAWGSPGQRIVEKYVEATFPWWPLNREKGPVLGWCSPLNDNAKGQRIGRTWPTFWSLKKTPLSIFPTNHVCVHPIRGSVCPRPNRRPPHPKAGLGRRWTDLFSPSVEDRNENASIGCSHDLEPLVESIAIGVNVLGIHSTPQYSSSSAITSTEPHALVATTKC